ncbi:iron permease FTR1 family-domain-containing protein [Gilbertella persicaria]|uniref:iron permease FTR1 family-domain-containing protein n=1 Tax=Gilbertella persicaria TaxID=101096 RepID=UPI00221EC8D2|nr:iron permease FTR1 family-domain-containing protein [Gilbertella persicaria]KAI8062305.1 iron permease FTR1 family-domain-containing protein [Gilbertella persicaria]
MSQDLFNVPIFFIIFRETCEAAIIVSVLLSFLKKVFDTDSLIYRRLRNQVWIGAGLGLFICLCIGAAFIAVWYTVLGNLWGNSEYIWEGVFSLVATVMITMMGLAMLRTERMQEKWKVKLAKSMEDKGEKLGFKAWMQKYSFFFLPFITLLREGLEAVVFIGGVSLNVTAKSIPIAAIMGFICGCIVGLIIYRGGSLIQLRWFFIASTIILYLVAAGLMSKAVGFLEQDAWNRVIGGESAEESGSVIGYKVTTAVWHVSWGDPEKNSAETGGWQIFNAILGWNNTATIGTIISYCLYWVLVSLFLVYMHWKEHRAALMKLQRGDWEPNGDVALDQAKKFIDKEGAIVGQEEQAVDAQNFTGVTISDAHEETIEIETLHKKLESKA